MAESSFAKLPLHRFPATRLSGFTLVEILIVMAIIAVLASISYPFYTDYVDRAKLTLGIGTLDTVRKTFENYFADNGNYPPDIDLSTGKDSLGKVLLTTSLLDEFKRNITSMESYVVAADDYTMTVKAKDSKQTLLVLTPRQTITQGP